MLIKPRPLYEYIQVVKNIELEFKVTPNMKERVMAYTLIKLFRDLAGVYTTFTLIETKASQDSFLRFLSREEKITLANEGLKFASKLLNVDNIASVIQTLVIEALRKYVWARYFALLPYTSDIQLLCLLFYPPSMVYTVSHLDMKLSNWRNLFIPLRKDGKPTNRGMIAKTFYTSAYLQFFGAKYNVNKKYLMSKLKVYYSCDHVTRLVEDMFRRETKSLLGQAVEFDKIPVAKRRQITLRVFRDLLRIYLLNTYLVALYYLKYRNVENIRIDKVKLPYELLHTPLAVQDYLEPMEIVHRDLVGVSEILIPELREISWKKLIADILGLKS